MAAGTQGPQQQGGQSLTPQQQQLGNIASAAPTQQQGFSITPAAQTPPGTQLGGYLPQLRGIMGMDGQPQQRLPIFEQSAQQMPPQGSPNTLSIAPSSMPLNQQGPALGQSLPGLFAQLRAAEQKPMPIFNQAAPSPQLTPYTPPPPMPTPPAPPPQLQAAFQAASNQMAGHLDNYVAPTPAPAAPAAAPRPDADFNINNAMNTFGRSLNERVQSGQMSVADAQRAQAEMRALQLNPAMANRAAATEIAQRALQVGPYAPRAASAAPMATAAPTPAPAAPAIPQGWDVASAYRDFGSKLGDMIKSGKLTPQQANALKDPAFQATRLGNTAEAYAAMQRAIAGAGFADGGYVTQVAPEDPRMQAMRYIQQLGSNR